MSGSTIHQVKELPSDDHWAVVYDESLQYDDGYGHHGSPSYNWAFQGTPIHRNANTMNYTVMISFKNEEELRGWIMQNDESTCGKKNYRVIFVKPATVRKQVSFEIGV